MDLASAVQSPDELPFWRERCELACAFRWAAHLNFHAVSAHYFSLAVPDDGRQLRIASHEVTMKIAQQWFEPPQFAEKHFCQLIAICDEKEPDYKA